MPLTVHFLNVGRGDCTIIEFPSGRVGIVDIDNLRVLDEYTKSELLAEYHLSMNYIIRKAAAKSVFETIRLDSELIKKAEENLTDPLAYYDANIGSKRDIFRFIVTHPDMDHMTGLCRLHEQDARKSILNFWHTGQHDFNLADCADDAWGPYDKRDWETYRALRASSDAPKSLQKHQGAEGEFWTEDLLEVWAPTPELEELAVEKNEANILSMVLKISYMGHSILLGGDATANETWPTIYPTLDMTGINVLKASHHGRKSGYYGLAVKEMAPWLTITSVGEVEHDATPNYRRYSEHTVSLRKAGDITIRITDDGVLHYPASIEEHWKDKKVDA
jgi:beta-lactamase superfamily II metal-dependent hydrolase